MTLHLNCAFEVIILRNKKIIIALFHHFFLQFVHIDEIRQKVHNTTATFNLYSGGARVQKLRDIPQFQLSK